MESQNNKNDFSELQSLLSSQNEALPPCDLDAGFLSDLHVKLRSESMKKSAFSLLCERVEMRANSLLNPSAAWGGAAFATVALALGLGYFFTTTDANKAQVAKTDSVYESPYLVTVKADKSIDFEGTLPAFSNIEQDF